MREAHDEVSFAHEVVVFRRWLEELTDQQVLVVGRVLYKSLDGRMEAIDMLNRAFNKKGTL